MIRSFQGENFGKSVLKVVQKNPSSMGNWGITQALLGLFSAFFLVPQCGSTSQGWNCWYIYLAAGVSTIFRTSFSIDSLLYALGTSWHDDLDAKCELIVEQGGKHFFFFFLRRDAKTLQVEFVYCKKMYRTGDNCHRKLDSPVSLATCQRE